MLRGGERRVLGLDSAQQVEDMVRCSRTSANSANEVGAGTFYLVAARSPGLVILIPEIGFRPPKIGDARLPAREGKTPDDALVVALILRAGGYSSAESKRIGCRNSGTE